MPTPAPDQLAKLRSETLAAGAAFIDDLEHLRAMLAAEAPTRDDIRRASLTLRRLLIDGELRRLAAPRIGRLHFDVPDNNPVYKAAAKEPFLFFASAGFPVGGTVLRALSASRGKQRRVLAKDFDADRTASVSLDGFLAQRVLCVNGSWITRDTLIRYTSEIATGNHPGETAPPEQALLIRVRDCASVSVQGDTVALRLDTEAPRKQRSDLSYDPAALDPALIELLAACRSLTQSADIKSLEATLATELNQRPS
jgi:hypothetical protein